MGLLRLLASNAQTPITCRGFEGSEALIFIGDEGALAEPDGRMHCSDDIDNEQGCP